jgi:Domain of unknown function (DUF4389)
LSSAQPPAARFCTRCGAARVPQARYCAACGAALDQQAPPSWPAPPPHVREADPVPVPWLREGSTHPVRLVVGRPARHGRLGALVRLPAGALAGAVALAWSVAAVGAAVLAWPVRVAGRPYPRRLHGVAQGWLRYATRASCYGLMVSPAFPRAGPGQAVDVELPEPSGRPWLRLPALVPAVPLAVLEWLVAVLCAPVAWVAVLATGRVPDGLADVMEQPQRYGVRFWAYALLLTDAYPWFQPELDAVRTQG